MTNSRIVIDVCQDIGEVPPIGNKKFPMPIPEYRQATELLRYLKRYQIGEQYINVN